ncbi:glucose-1-phosphate adenylyltransferase subunit GlgD [Ruminococcaceae bacterium OttesenSCG-928-L11]|nr:glucose-1-phosphate adenylyltransferase subunit GlgD [Ruminococcaceae bacterium OttesenSCG-928-L11]
MSGASIAGEVNPSIGTTARVGQNTVMKNVLGVIFSNMHDHMVSELTNRRCMGSIPVGGRYRLIDFALSSMANAGIEDVGVITKSNYQSLMDHLGNGREWDLSRKRGGLVILPPFGRMDSTGMYHNRVEALAGVMDFIRASQAEHMLITDCDYIANVDYTELMESHFQSGADISLLFKKVRLEGEGSKDVCTFALDKDNNVIDMLIHNQISGEQNVYLNTMFVSRNLLERLIVDCYSRNLTSFDKDVLQAGIGKYKVHACEFTGYAGRIDSMKSFFNANMAMMDGDVRKSLFPQDRPVYTKIRDEAPVRYGLDSNVRSCLLGDGCVIEGEIENSILFRGVKVEKGAKVRNCIIMQGTTIGAGSNLEYVVTDKDVTVAENRMVMGFETYPVYVSKGSVV